MSYCSLIASARIPESHQLQKRTCAPISTARVTVTPPPLVHFVAVANAELIITLHRRISSHRVSPRLSPLRQLRCSVTPGLSSLSRCCRSRRAPALELNLPPPATILLRYLSYALRLPADLLPLKRTSGSSFSRRCFLIYHWDRLRGWYSTRRTPAHPPNTGLHHWKPIVPLLFPTAAELGG